MAEVNTKLISNVSYDINKPEPKNDPLKTHEDFSTLCLKFKQAFDNSKFPLERAMFTDEFHGLMFGANANPEWRKVALLVSDIVESIIKLYKPSSALVCDAAPVFTRAAQHILEVDTLNTMTTAVIDRFLDKDNLSNVNVIPYSQIHQLNKKYDMSIILMGHCHNNDLLDFFIDSVKDNGVLLITNSSYAGQMYENENHQSRYIHDIIVNTNLFSIYHIASPIAVTLCIKDKNKQL